MPSATVALYRIMSTLAQCSSSFTATGLHLRNDTSRPYAEWALAQVYKSVLLISGSLFEVRFVREL